jgi:hypothetical protein
VSGSLWRAPRRLAAQRPEGESLDEVRRIRDQIRERVERLAAAEGWNGG